MKSNHQYWADLDKNAASYSLLSPLSFIERAAAIGARVVWMQLGIVHEEAAQKARDAGLEVVADRCIKIEHELC